MLFNLTLHIPKAHLVEWQIQVDSHDLERIEARNDLDVEAWVVGQGEKERRSPRAQLKETSRRL